MSPTAASSLLVVALTCVTLPSFAQDGVAPPAAAAPGEHTAAPAPVRPDADVPRGVQLGVRAGVPLGAGEVQKGLKMTDLAKAAIPVWFDVGYRFSNVYLGGYAEYIYLVPNSGPGGCPPGGSCSAHGLALGLNAHYHVRPGRSLDPWFGVGTGYEMVSMSGNVGPTELGLDAGGIQYFNLQGGADFAIAHLLAAGPFLTAGLGQFSRLSTKVGPVETSGGIPSDERTLHMSVLLGVRGSFNVIAMK